MAREERGTTGRAGRTAASVSVTEIAATLQVPETVVRSYLATQTFRGVRLIFTAQTKRRRRVRQWRQRPLRGM